MGTQEGERSQQRSYRPRSLAPWRERSWVLGSHAGCGRYSRMPPQAFSMQASGSIFFRADQRNLSLIEVRRPGSTPLPTRQLPREVIVVVALRRNTASILA